MAPTFEQVYPVLYKEWPIEAARADFELGNWRNKAGAEQFMDNGAQTSGDPMERATQSILDSFTRLQTEATQKFTQFQEANPFKLDEILAEKRTQASEQLDPYYNETLADYLTGVERKRTRSVSDTQDLLTELSATSDSFTGATRLKLDEAKNKAREGFAETGLFESGSRYRSEGLLEREAGDTLSDFDRRQTLRTKTAETGLDRTLEDLALGRKQDVRNIERERFSNVENLANTLTKEEGQRYVTGFQASLPPELQANQNFDLLKSIGIYG